MWRKFLARAPAERWLLVRALVSLALARVELAVLPFSLLRKRPRICPKKGVDALRVAWAVEAGSRFVPGATCLVKALAAQRLLAAYGHPSAVRIGVSRSGDFQAHAWVEYNGAVLVGAIVTPYVPLVQWSGAQ